MTSTLEKPWRIGSNERRIVKTDRNNVARSETSQLPRIRAWYEIRASQCDEESALHVILDGGIASVE